MGQKIEKIGVGVALALGWPILSVACSHTIRSSMVAVRVATLSLPPIIPVFTE